MNRLGITLTAFTAAVGLFVGLRGGSAGADNSTAPAVATDATQDKAATRNRIVLRTAEDFGLPRPGMTLDRETLAVVCTDPQVDFLSEKGVAWGVVEKSAKENNTVENIERVFKATKDANLPLFISPHWYYPHDHHWKFEGALEVLMHNIHMFDRKGQLDTNGFKNSGSDWLEQYKPYIEDGKTIVCSPHKIYGPEQNDLVLQLRKYGINQLILIGMSANLCVESHLRELVEQGFEVVVVQDATAAAITNKLDGYKAALTNFRYIASAVVTTDRVVEALKELGARNR